MEKEIGKTALITSKVEELAAEIKAAGSQAISLTAEVENAKDVEQVFQKTVDAFDTMDVVVDAAGIMPLFPIASANPET
jgi:3-oxoacyl-[acyl-carrier protein] reductase